MAIAAYRPRAPLFYVAVFVAATVMAAALTVIVVALIVGGEEGPIEHAVELAFSVGFLCLGIHQANTFIGYTFLIFDQGFTQRRRQGEGEIVPWSAVAELRPRPIWQRLDLRAADGRLLATLEYQVDGIEQAFIDIVARAAPPPPKLPFTLRRGWSFTRIVLAAIIAASTVLTVLIARSQPVPAAAFAIAALGIAYGWYSTQRTALREVTTSAHGLVIHRGNVELRIPWRDVLHIAFDSRTGGANTYMNASVALRDGTAESIVPSGREADTVRAYVAAQAAWRRAMSVEGGASGP